MNKEKLIPITFLVFALIVFLAPVFLRGPFPLHVLTIISIFIIPTLGLRLMAATGLVSFAHAAFMAVGAYTSALLVLRLGLSFWLALPLAGVAAAILALIFGAPLLRLKGPYFFLGSFAFGILILLLFGLSQGLFGGYRGISDIPPPSLYGLGYISGIAYYYLAAALMLLGLLIAFRLQRSRFGMTLRAIRDSDLRAECVGVDTMKYKLIAFMIACFFAGIGGSLYSHYVAWITPDVFGMKLSIYFVIYMIVGGINSVAGPVIGVASMSALSAFLRNFGQYEPLLFGVIMIVLLLFSPGGIAGLAARAWSRAGRLVRTKGDVPKHGTA